MAIWQFSFHVVPRSKGLEYYNLNKKVQNPDEVISWQGYLIDENSVKKLSEELGCNKSWSEDVKLLGSVEQSCVELFYEGEFLYEVSVRLDLRCITSDLLQTIIDFIKSNNAMILTNDGFIIMPEVKEIINQIKKSQSYSFLKDSIRFLIELEEIIE